MLLSKNPMTSNIIIKLSIIQFIYILESFCFHVHEGQHINVHKNTGYRPRNDKNNYYINELIILKIAIKIIIVKTITIKIINQIIQYSMMKFTPCWNIL